MDNNNKLKKIIGPVILVLILAFMISLPLFAQNYTIILLRTILMYVALTLSWVLFSGFTGYTSLATAVFYGTGLYTAGVLNGVLPLPLLMLCSGLISAVLALIIGTITLRLRGIYFAIFTLSSVELIKHVLNWYEINVLGVRGHYVTRVDYGTVYYILLAIVVLILITTYLIKRSRYGLALSGIKSCEEAAVHTGVNATALKVLLFALSAFFIGMTGTVMATGMLYVDSIIAFNLNYSFFPTLMAIFGGMSSMFGPIIGATVFAYLQEYLITRSPDAYMFIFGLVMIITILYLPDGLVGLYVRIRELLLQKAIPQIRRKISGGKHANTAS
ncbi:MAG: branched-chain amino acid ABC transporter permease [Bacillota bacterium]|jgi:branched-chain amino acid transport system permease protein|nr:branched-chain amino acid ABC transporter permease [Bacillota bacterium]HHU29971.1 branched-chain amino acid ABC transporter permease [Bacillota bacterium]